MRALISAAVADGSIDCQDVKLTAFTLAGALNWGRWHHPDGSRSPEDIAAGMVDILTAGLAPR